MDKVSQIKAKLREVVGADPNYPIPATVTRVKGETCSVKFANGFEVSDVRLKATISGNGDFVLITPEVGSDVLLLSGDGTLRNLTVIKVDRLAKLQYKQNALEVLVDSTDKKVSVKNDQTSLLDILNDLTGLLKQLKVFTPVGPSGTPLPDTIVAIEQLELKFKKLLK